MYVSLSTEEVSVTVLVFLVLYILLIFSDFLFCPPPLSKFLATPLLVVSTVIADHLEYYISALTARRCLAEALADTDTANVQTKLKVIML